MKCPKCRSENLQIIESRQKPDYIRRRRWCSDCNHRFSTAEIPVAEYETMKEKVALLKRILEAAQEVINVK